MKVRIEVIQKGGRIYSGEIELQPSSRKHRVSSQTGNGKARRSDSRASKPTSVLKELYRSGFFVERKTLAEVVKVFGKKGHNPNKSTIASALYRAPFLRTLGPRGAYKYIQKYPPSR